MKVNIYTTVEVSDAQRIAIAAEIDGEGAKPRSATRDEMKEFVWREGENWAASLTTEDAAAADGPIEEEPAAADEGDGEEVDFL